MRWLLLFLAVTVGHTLEAETSWTPVPQSPPLVSSSLFPNQAKTNMNTNNDMDAFLQMGSSHPGYGVSSEGASFEVHKPAFPQFNPPSLYNPPGYALKSLPSAERAGPFSYVYPTNTHIERQDIRINPREGKVTGPYTAMRATTMPWIYLPYVNQKDLYNGPQPIEYKQVYGYQPNTGSSTPLNPYTKTSKISLHGLNPLSVTQPLEDLDQADTVSDPSLDIFKGSAYSIKIEQRNANIDLSGRTRDQNPNIDMPIFPSQFYEMHAPTPPLFTAPTPPSPPSPASPPADDPPPLFPSLLQIQQTITRHHHTSHHRNTRQYHISDRSFSHHPPPRHRSSFTGPSYHPSLLSSHTSYRLPRTAFRREEVSRSKYSHPFSQLVIQHSLPFLPSSYHRFHSVYLANHPSPPPVRRLLL